uniref:G patch domain-containing protein 11 n=1 Tax=Timema bartmani TaxID=61472 RepID=A0A7R9F7A1_9NEOP|nr:unnamed protein product [Timema bartmani]
MVCYSIPNDVRPGLIRDHSLQRQAEMDKKKQQTNMKNKEHFRSHRAVELERREEGLSSALSNNNKGFALMQKMGYKPGSGIGKSGTVNLLLSCFLFLFLISQSVSFFALVVVGSGRVEPVTIALKTDRQGIGRETALRRLAVEKAAIRQRQRQRREQEFTVENFRAHRSQKHLEIQTAKDLRSCQRVCEGLDKGQGYDEPAEPWFWLTREKEDDDDDDHDDKVEGQDEKTRTADESGEGDDEEEEEEAEIEFQPSEKLDMLSNYLRQTYCYCVWCGTQYDDDKDMRDNCPGPTRDDH